MRTDDDYAEERYDEEYDDEPYYEDEPAHESRTYAEEDDGWWDEGLISLLLIAGVILFLIPEPTTSLIGILLLLTGSVAWLVDWAM